MPSEPESSPLTDSALIARLKALAPPPRVTRIILTSVRVVIAAAVVVFMYIRLSEIGWNATWAALPRAPMFYVFFAIAYWVLPLAELLIYRTLWPIRWRALPVFIRKRVYNELMFDYSGEAYLYLWAKDAVPDSTNGKGPGSTRGILSTIKDVNLLSGLTSNSLTLLMLPVVILGGRVRLLEAPGDHPLVPLLLCAVLALVLMTMLFVFRQRIFSLSRKDAAIVGGLHVTRLLTIFALQVAQWSAALPQVPVAEWLMFLAAQLLLTRIPFLPNRDVMMMWLGVALATAVAAPQAQVASMFLAAGALSLATHTLMYGLVLGVGLVTRKGRTGGQSEHPLSQSEHQLL